MRLMKKLWLPILASVLAAACTITVPGGSDGGSSARRITSNSAGPVRIGMTVAEARKALPGRTLARTTDGEGVALIEVKEGQTLEMLLYAGEENAESPVDEQARIELINVYDSRYQTAESVHPGMPVSEIEAKYGKLTRIVTSEIESREYAEFPKAPAGLSFQVGLPEDGGTARVVTNILVSGNS